MSECLQPEDGRNTFQLVADCSTRPETSNLAAVQGNRALSRRRLHLEYRRGQSRPGALAPIERPGRLDGKISRFDGSLGRRTVNIYTLSACYVMGGEKLLMPRLENEFFSRLFVLPDARDLDENFLLGPPIPQHLS